MEPEVRLGTEQPEEGPTAAEGTGWSKGQAAELWGGGRKAYLAPRTQSGCLEGLRVCVVKTWA